MVGIIYLLLALTGVFMLELGIIMSLNCCLVILFFSYTGVYSVLRTRSGFGGLEERFGRVG